MLHANFRRISITVLMSFAVKFPSGWPLNRGMTRIRVSSIVLVQFKQSSPSNGHET